MGGASIIGIVNQKGGTGKTTSCVNLGVDLAREGKRVLLVDCDPQGSLTISLGHPQPDTLPVTLADQMTAVLNDSPIDPGGILHHDEGVDLLPANISLAGMEVSLVNAMSRETTLKRVLANYSKDYDHILLDCSPVEPQTEPGTKADWPHGEATKRAGGSTMEPNPIKKNSTASLSTSEPQGFTDVWIAYPANRRTLRREAARLVAKALDEGATIDSILAALEAEKQSYSWREENGRFIPGIVKWLEKETWRSFVQQAETVEEDEEWTSF